jgi:hypothetical protein
MFLASKAAWTGIALIWLATGISGPRPAPLPSGANPSNGAPAGVHRSYETAKGKPSAYMNRAKGLGRTSKTPRKPVKAVAAAESGLEDRQKSLQAENDNHPQ